MQGTKSDVRFILVLLTLSLCGNVLLTARLLSNSGRGARPIPTPDEYTDWFARQSRQDVPVDAEGAAVLVLEFSDYQCPACLRVRGEYRPVVQRLMADYPRDVKFLAKDFPLESECNPAVKKDIHPAACESAAAVRLAEQTGRGEELAELLFSRQASLTPDSVWEVARSVTRNPNIKGEYANVLNHVKNDVALGEKLGVQGTPTLFVNGVDVGAPPASLLEAVILHELKAARSARANLRRHHE